MRLNFRDDIAAVAKLRKAKWYQGPPDCLP